MSSNTNTIMKPTPHYPNALARREFLKSVGAGTLAALSARLPTFAGPFEGADFAQLIPADKKLRPEWLKSLFERGVPTEYRGAELDKIGMPIGGIGTGQLYLGGDGRMWHWDLFNLPQPRRYTSTDGPNYAKPPAPHHPLEQGFSLRIGGTTRPLDRRGFSDIRFRGQYPIAFVDYRADDCPVTVALEAFTPYCPLNVADSSLPATVMRFVVKNTSDAPVEVEVFGTLENAVCLASGRPKRGMRRNQILREPGLTVLHCTAEAIKPTMEIEKRPDILFEDFENGYGNWKIEGEAFGERPATGTLPGQQQVSGFVGRGLVNSFLRGDDTTGRLVSRVFKIERRHLTFLVGGGVKERHTCMDLVVNGRAVRTASGRDLERLEPGMWDVADLQGKEAHLEIVDPATGPWGHLNIDQIVLTDTPLAESALDAEPDFGSLGLSLLGEHADQASGDATAPFGEKLIGSLGRTLRLAPGAEAEATFVLTWFFPVALPGHSRELADGAALKRSYANRFDSAAAVARYLAANFDRLAGQTRLWNRTWYDSTLPYWFLDRTFAPICTLATSTCYHLSTGRFYAFEGVYCCGGTCQHVWNYAQSVGRIFPELERDLRRRTDFGTAWHDNGAIDYRGEVAKQVAHDGQCGVILRAYREHLTAADDTYLRACWPRIRKSIEFMIAQDGDDNGLLEGEQYNTLDASWFGPMAWISSLYIAALRAGATMACEMGDGNFSALCTRIATRGSELLAKDLFNGEYFIHKPDPRRPNTPNSNDGCHIDQLMGQAWALQVGLPRIAPAKETTAALEAIWRYNFTLDVGPFRDKTLIKGGRWYAMAGEGGVVMTTFPRGGAEKSTGKAFGHYLNEVWTGQEHQLAAHMIWEGLVEKGFAVTRVVHDRHHAARRNPYNEIECSDHYTRAMASYGSFIAACGFDYHGPKAQIAFAPRVTPEHFKAAFTAAEGWGSFTQHDEGGQRQVRIELLYGRLRVKTITLSAAAAKSVAVRLNETPVAATHEKTGDQVMIELTPAIRLEAGQTLVLDFK